MTGLEKEAECLFCKFISHKVPTRIFWEDANHLAFLSIYPNTPGVSVVVPKKHLSSYAFEQSDKDLCELIIASKKVSKILDESLNGVGRSGLILEGFGINHLHAKLFPLHGTEAAAANWQPIKSSINTFMPSYVGYISSHDCNLSSSEDIDEVYKTLLTHPDAKKET